MTKPTNESEQKIVAKNEPVIDSISSGTTYYSSNKNKGDKFFMIGILVVSAIFIAFLPAIYNFLQEHRLSDMFKKETPVHEEGEKNPTEEDPKKEEETFVAKVCTKSTADDVVTAHTLYFSNSKLKKVSLAETYTLGQNYNSKELDQYYEERKEKFGGYDSVSIETTIDENTYNATALIDLKESPKTAEGLMNIKLEYNNKQKDVLNAYEENGFDCE